MARGTGDRTSDGAVIDLAFASVRDLAHKCTDVIILVDTLRDIHTGHLQVDDRAIQFTDQTGVDISCAG